MVLLSGFRGSYSAVSSFFQQSAQRSSSLHEKEKVLVTVPSRRCYSSWTVRSILSSRKSCINDNGATEPARVLLERLFTQTQKLEKMSGDSDMEIDSQIGFYLDILETDLQAALFALKKKEEDLEEAERKVLLEQNKINSAKEELACREQEICSASFKQEKLEEELKQANLRLSCQASDIDDLKVHIEHREKEIGDAYSKLALKEGEIKKMISELTNQSELLKAAESDLEEKASLLDEAYEVMKKQEVEIQLLQKQVQGKEDDLKVSSNLREMAAEKLKATEISLEKQTSEWLIAQDDLKKLAAEALKQTREANATAKSFQRVKKLLSEVRSELRLSQKALGSSRQKVEDRDLLIQKQVIELEEEKLSLKLYMENLKNVQLELENERVKLTVAEARNKELERDLSVEKELIAQLQAELDRQKSYLEKEIREKSILQVEVDRESSKVGEAQFLLRAKESELVEAKLEMQRLKSEHDSLEITLEERDSELCDAKKNLEDVMKEIIELKSLLSSRGIQLMHTEDMLKEKEEHVQEIQLELNNTKLRSSESEMVIERILQLTQKLRNSVEDDTFVESSDVAGESKWGKKHLEMELEIARESLRTKEIEAVAAQRALAMKEEELKRVHDNFEKREREIQGIKDEIKQDTNVLKQLYSLPMSDLVTEKLQIEAAQLEAEAAKAALYKLTEMSSKLLCKSTLNTYADSNSSNLSEFRKEVSRLSTLTEKLVKEAGIVEDVY